MGLVGATKLIGDEALLIDRALDALLPKILSTFEPCLRTITPMLSSSPVAWNRISNAFVRFNEQVKVHMDLATRREQTHLQKTSRLATSPALRISHLCGQPHPKFHRR